MISGELEGICPHHNLNSWVPMFQTMNPTNLWGLRIHWPLFHDIRCYYNLQDSHIWIEFCSDRSVLPMELRWFKESWFWSKFSCLYWYKCIGFSFDWGIFSLTSELAMPRPNRLRIRLGYGRIHFTANVHTCEFDFIYVFERAAIVTFVLIGLLRQICIAVHYAGLISKHLAFCNHGKY